MAKMTQIQPQQLRLGLMGLIAVITLLVLGKIVVFPTQLDDLATPFEFPETIPLNGWEPLDTQPLEKKTEDRRFLTGQAYQYQQNQQVLDVQTWYMIRTNGDVHKFFQDQIATLPTPQSKLAVNENPDAGFYGLGATEERAYLSSCINPNGGSTVTVNQFRNNRNTYDLKLSRILPWLLGPYELRDSRCIWTVLSLPLDGDQTAEDVYPTLKTAWLSWYQWWQPNFPPQ